MNIDLLAADMAARAAIKTAQEYHNATVLHPIGAASVLLLGTWLFLATRKNAMLPLMILICFIPSAQRIVIAGADFTLLRIMVLFGVTRIIARGELASVKLNRIDITYVIWVIVGSLVYVLQKQEVSAFVYVCGTSMDMVGAYVLARTLIQNIDDLRRFARIIAQLAVVVSMLFVTEYVTGRNLFSIFGGVPEMAEVRDGRLRCQGAFSHPILAGVFWAAMAAFLIGHVMGAKRRLGNVLAVVACGLIIVASSSSTPLLGFVAALAFWMCWPVRSWMRYAFMILPLVLLGLHLVMEKPVWHLISRVSAVGGSTGYHRYVLIDGAVGHFHEWWMVGTSWTGHWSEHFQTWDITNQYIFEGVRGGIWRLGLFALLILFASLAIGRAQRLASSRADRLLCYGVAASLFVHCVCFIGVSYFGQIQYVWYMTLAIASSAGTRQFFADQPSSVALEPALVPVGR